MSRGKEPTKLYSIDGNLEAILPNAEQVLAIRMEIRKTLTYFLSMFRDIDVYLEYLASYINTAQIVKDTETNPKWDESKYTSYRKSMLKNFPLVLDDEEQSALFKKRLNIQSTHQAVELLIAQTNPRDQVSQIIRSCRTSLGQLSKMKSPGEYDFNQEKVLLLELLNIFTQVSEALEKQNSVESINLIKTSVKTAKTLINKNLKE